jgi:hypothetical protein
MLSPLDVLSQHVGDLLTQTEASRIVVFDDNYKPEASVSHRNARLTTYGRRLLVERVRFQGMP